MSLKKSYKKSHASSSSSSWDEYKVASNEYEEVYELIFKNSDANIKKVLKLDYAQLIPEFARDILILGQERFCVQPNRKIRHIVRKFMPI